MILCERCRIWYHIECVKCDETSEKNFYCPSCIPENGIKEVINKVKNRTRSLRKMKNGIRSKEQNPHPKVQISEE